MQLDNKTVISIDATGFKVAVAVSRFNESVTKKLLESTLETLKSSGVILEDIRIVEVAGAVELPYALHVLAQTKKYNCLIALGCVIRGETPHFDYVCKMAQEGVLRVSLDQSIPIGFGVLTVHNQDQAKARIHVGAEAALAALELAKIK